MGTSPEALKEEIDRTRADLAANVDALALKVTPVPATRKLVAGGVIAGGLLVFIRRIKHRKRSSRSR